MYLTGSYRSGHAMEQHGRHRDIGQIKPLTYRQRAYAFLALRDGYRRYAEDPSLRGEKSLSRQLQRLNIHSRESSRCIIALGLADDPGQRFARGAGYG